MNDALGLLETKGLVALVEATDAMAKAANVKIIKKIAYEVFEVTGKNPLLDIALELERIALQEDLFSVQERDRLVTNTANDGLWDYDVRENSMYFSPRWRAMRSPISLLNTATCRW